MRLLYSVQAIRLLVTALCMLMVPLPAMATEATSIIRGDGDDTITIERGNYLIDGGNGNDTLVLPYFPNVYRVTATDGDQVTVECYDSILTIKGIEYVQFGGSHQTTIPLDSLLQGKAQQDLNRLTDLYLSFFGRPPDIEGMEYWQERLLEEGRGIGDIAKDFAWSAEAQKKFPTGTSDREFIRQTYQNCFGREPDPGGWDYWTGRLQTVGDDLSARGTFVAELVLGAYATTSGDRDRNYLTNRHEISLSYLNLLAKSPYRYYETAFLDLLDLVNDGTNTLRDAHNVLDRLSSSWTTLEHIMSHKDLLETLWTNDPSRISDKIFGFENSQLQYCVNDIRGVTGQRLSEITELRCARKGISSLQGIQNMTGLQVLELHDTGISDLAPLRGLIGLTTLSIDGLRANDLSPLQDLTSLTTLSISGSWVKDLTPLQDLTSLTTLSLDVYTESDITPLRYLTNLTSLSLAGARVSDISPLGNLTNLTSLTLRGPGHRDIGFPWGISEAAGCSDILPLAYLQNLEHLNIGGNLISDLAPLHSLVKLKYLAIDDNEIEDITPLQGLVNLEELDIEKNHIVDLTPLQGVTSLTTLVISQNLISDISPLQHLTKLESLQLGANRLYDITPVQNLLALHDLELAHNKVSDVSPLKDLTALSQLDLDNNLVSDISPLQSMGSLNELVLSRNQITDISPLKDLNQLTSLSLSHNRISDISALQTLPSLNQLSLIDNRICDFSPLDNLPAMDIQLTHGNECTDAPDTTTECEPGTESLGQAKVYFEYSYENYAWVPTQHGFYINSLGEAYSYDNHGSYCLEKGSHPYCPDFTDAAYCPRPATDSPVCLYSAENNPNSEVNLLARLSANQTYLGQIDPAVVAEMYAKVSWAASGKLSLPQHTASDAGSWKHTAYVYDCAGHAYRPVLLSETGDMTVTNSAPEAAQLTKWLGQAIRGINSSK